MNESLYKIVYCSRSELRGTPAQVVGEMLQILERARVKNTQLGITGALLSVGGNFAQVLEGPKDAVEQVFSLVERDPRNSQVTVALRGPAVCHSFPRWTMAFADGEEDHRLPQLSDAIDGVFAHDKAAGPRLLSLLEELIFREDAVAQ